MTPNEPETKYPVWAVIDWRMVWQVMRSLDWNWADLARNMGIGESQVSMIRHGKRPVTMPFASMLGHATRLGFRMLIHPSVPRKLTAREELAIDHMEDGRPWPVAYSQEVDEQMTHERMKKWRIYQAHQRLGGVA